MYGYIKLHRKLLENPISSNAFLLGLTTFLLLKVNHIESVFYLGSEKITLLAGQVVTSQKKLASHFSVSISTIHRLLKVLQKEGVIYVKTNNKYSLITFPKWRNYQSSEKRKETEVKAVEKPIETNKKSKEDKEQKRKISIMISCIKEEIQKVKLVYNHTQDIEYAKKLLEDETFRELCKQRNMGSGLLAKDVIRKSYQLSFWKGPCTGPKSIFYNYADVLNLKSTAKENEIDIYINSLAPDVQSRLKQIKKKRTTEFPYKEPFSNMEHLKSFEKAIIDGKL